MSVTIRDVALKAGVSTAAVSKVLHGRGNSVRVSEARAVFIREIAKELDYRPNAVARNLRSSRTHTIGLIWEGFAGIASGPLYFMHLLDGIASEVLKNHYRLTILPELAHDNVLGTLGDGQLEGVIWCKMAKDEPTVQLIHDCPIPIVALNALAPKEDTEAVFISCENEAGIELAVAHLWGLGHRKVMFLREYEELTAPDCLARSLGFVEALERRGVSDAESNVFTWSWEFDEFPKWWSEKTGHTAVICWSERASARFMKRCVEFDISVPNQLSVVGFDSTQFCETTTPRLTAVRQPITEMAAHASRTLFSMISGSGPKPSSTTFPCSFDVRDSTAPPCLSAEENK